MEKQLVESHHRAIAEGYRPRPFFFRERRKRRTGFIAWAPHLQELKRVFCNLLTNFHGKVEVLLTKILWALSMNRLKTNYPIE